jgi:hypothetical protein
MTSLLKLDAISYLSAQDITNDAFCDSLKRVVSKLFFQNLKLIVVFVSVLLRWNRARARASTCACAALLLLGSMLSRENGLNSILETIRQLLGRRQHVIGDLSKELFRHLL